MKSENAPLENRLGMRPRRSALYMPGANARALEKARSLDADCLLLDLEDAVAPDAKDQARAQICDALRQGGYGARELVVRINALDTPWGADDVAALADLPRPSLPHAILAPKISTPEQIDGLTALMPEGCALWMVQGRAPLMTALSMAVLAARQYGLSILDGVFNDIADEAGFEAECRQAADMGFDGKTLIHPNQLAVCNALFAPSEEDVAQARNIVAAFAAPENAGKGVLKINGKMTELLHRDMAERILAIDAAIAARQEA